MQFAYFIDTLEPQGLFIHRLIKQATPVTIQKCFFLQSDLCCIEDINVITFVFDPTKHKRKMTSK